ncbi:MAG: aminotransferase class I/II-fold pyridoxal phosphate-dependent enzyme [Longimicrobiaceae bacterium]
MRPARRLDALPAYPVADLPAIKRDLRAKGVDVIDLGAGDADLSPPPAAVEALQRAAEDPANSRYAFQLGLPAYREEIVRWMGGRFGVTLDPYSEILPLIGTKEGIFHLPFAVLDPGEVTLVPDPGYAPYLGGTAMSGAEPHMLPLLEQNGFLADLDSIPEGAARRARVLYLNYPNNPTAAIAPRAYLEEAVRFCHEREIVLAFDNAYSEIAFDGYTPPSILEIDGAREVAVEFHSLSKTYNMTGWRVGWAAGSAEVITALARVKTFADTGVPFTIQHAATAALRAHDSWFPENRETFRRRRDAAVSALTQGGYQVSAPRATMYLWVPVPAGAGTSAEFTRRLLLEEGVAVLSGDALGASGDGFVRVALTSSEERLAEAARRMARLLE